MPGLDNHICSHMNVLYNEVYTVTHAFRASKPFLSTQMFSYNSGGQYEPRVGAVETSYNTAPLFSIHKKRQPCVMIMSVQHGPKVTLYMSLHSQEKMHAVNQISPVFVCRNGSLFRTHGCSKALLYFYAMQMQ